MVHGVDDGAAHPPDDLGEGGVAAHVGAQDEGVDEESDEVFEVGLVASCERAADGDVLAGAELGEQDGQRGVPDHEHGGVLGPREFGEPGVQVGRDVETHDSAFVRGGDGAWPVGGQREFFGGARQRRTPVGELLCEQAAGIVGVTEQFALPQGVVGVLHGQRRDVGFGPVQTRRVGDGEVPPERGGGPAVGGDVVQGDHQRRRPVVDGQQPGVEGDAGGQVEDVPGGAADLVLQLAGPYLVLGEQVGQVADGHDLLHGLAVDLAEPGPQRLVAGDHVVQRRPQRGHVRPPGQPQDQRNGVEGARSLQPVHEPQPALRIRRRNHVHSSMRAGSSVRSAGRPRGRVAARCGQG
ncbi:hypothetical protein EES44_18370 [Streptomyces sp. ADI96-15]|nr:hypothetical protein EES44_18370 [Streptomyces sp. ADI96-15]